MSNNIEGKVVVITGANPPLPGSSEALRYLAQRRGQLLHFSSRRPMKPSTTGTSDPRLLRKTSVAPCGLPQPRAVLGHYTVPQNKS
jgi:hypothetical protein